MMDTKQVKQIADKEVNKHEKRMHQGMAPTKLKKGGPTGQQMRAVGRNVARANNQRGK
jgi:hypothetical protein